MSANFTSVVIFNSGNIDSVKRGVQKSSENTKALTHCRNGHEYAEENTKQDKRGYRTCKQCSKDQKARQRIGPRVER